jgi:hypothetical protein
VSFARWRANHAPWAGLRLVVILVYLFSLGPIFITAAVMKIGPSEKR